LESGYAYDHSFAYGSQSFVYIYNNTPNQIKKALPGKFPQSFQQLRNISQARENPYTLPLNNHNKRSLTPLTLLDFSLSDMRMISMGYYISR